MVLTYAGAVTAWSALCWAGAHWFDGLTPNGRSELPVRLLTGDHNIRPQAGYTVSEERRPLAELRVIDGLVVTSHVRSVSQEMRYAESERAAIIAFDMAAYADLVSLDEMAAYLATTSGWTGVPQARAALAHGDENSWSPRETAMRCIWERDAGLPRPVTNRPIFDRRGNMVGTPDLLDVEAGLIGEYDGELHLDGARRAHDLRREAVFRSLGLESVTMVRADSSDRSGLVRRILQARSRAKFEAPADRLWTIDPPPWWTPTHTVAQRRALNAGQRERYLGIRRPAA